MSSIDSFNKRYASLFGEKHEGDDEPSEADKQWGWSLVLHQVSNGRRMDWDYFLDMNIVAFFNYLAFCKDQERKLRRMQSGIDKINGNR